MPDAVSGSGKGDGRSSTFRECGLRKGPVVMGKLLVEAKGPLAPAPITSEEPPRGY
jgi:hypothetical protein